MATPSKGNNNKQVKLSQDQIAEIRNALAIILGNTQLLEREPGFTRDQKKKLTAIAKQTHRIARILEKEESEDCKKFSGGILKGLKEINETLLEK